MTDPIRERIARALVPHVEVCPGFWCPGALGGCFECWALAVEAADAVLAEFPALAGVTDEMVEAGARALAGLEPGEDWPTNGALGGGGTGTRDDEYRDGLRDQASEVLAAAWEARTT